MRFVLFLLSLLLFSQLVFGELSVSPGQLSFSVHGGESVEREIVVSNGFLVPALVSLRAVVSSESGDVNGFVVSFDKNSFVLLPGEPVGVVVSFSVASNILPERYLVELNAMALVDVPEPVPSAPVVSGGGGGSGGGRWLSVPILPPVDLNVVDENVVVPVPVKPRPPTPCVQEGELFWHRECCEGLIKRPTTLTCEKPDIVLPGKPVEPEPEPEPDWSPWYYAGFMVVALVILGVYARKRKKWKKLRRF